MTGAAALRVLVVGVGGLGCPAAIALAEAGVGELALADDDEVEVTNLHRQILYRDEDVGRRKVEVALERLAPHARRTKLRAVGGRFLPSRALDLLEGIDVVVEGADNFPTKFLVADACARAGLAVVHGAALGWGGTVLAVPAGGRPCYRCVFEDVPDGPAPSCADAGVMGPVCGVVGALMAQAALDLAAGRGAGALWSFDGLGLSARRRAVRARPSCSLCGPGASPFHIDPERYRGGTA